MESSRGRSHRQFSIQMFCFEWNISSVPFVIAYLDLEKCSNYWGFFCQTPTISQRVTSLFIAQFLHSSKWYFCLLSCSKLTRPMASSLIISLWHLFIFLKALLSISSSLLCQLLFQATESCLTLEDVHFKISECIFFALLEVNFWQGWPTSAVTLNQTTRVLNYFFRHRNHSTETYFAINIEQREDAKL